jgi:hypothetical protein
MSTPPTRGLTLTAHAHEWDATGACTRTVDRNLACHARRCRAPACDAARVVPVDYCAAHHALARQLTMPAHRPRVVSR